MTSTQSKTCIKKLLNFVTEIETNPNQYYLANPSKDNILIWHALIWNLEDEFSNGHYIMQITFPGNYPFKAPSFKFLTPNGKFAINTDICLSNSSYHNESWSPLWGLDQIMMGTISIFYEKNTSGVGHLPFNGESIIKFAKESSEYNNKYLAAINASFFC